jgi:hypothetical protein
MIILALTLMPGTEQEDVALQTSVDASPTILTSAVLKVSTVETDGLTKLAQSFLSLAIL